MGVLRLTAGMIDIQLYRARIGVFTFTDIYGVSLERTKGKKDIHLITKEASK